MPLKICRCCKQQKNRTFFGKDLSRKDGLNVYCKECIRNRSKQVYYKNHIFESKRRKEYLKNNPEVSRKASLKWSRNNRAIGVKNKMRRRDKQRQSTPLWLTKEHISIMNKFYNLATKLSKNSRIKFHVDHIIPIQGKEISGLHVPWNLQILEASVNIRKGNTLV